MKLHDYLTDVRWMMYSPDLADPFTPTGSILLCWLIWKSREIEGPVEATIAEIMSETGLSEKNTETALKRLDGIVSVTRKRMEHRTFYAIDYDELRKTINHWNGVQ